MSGEKHVIRSIEILQLPALSLQELIEQALEENEALAAADWSRHSAAAMRAAAEAFWLPARR